jgi:Tfp pilus assembly protein PilX
MNSRRPNHYYQSGAVLFMTLIFLVLLTVMALTTFTLGKGTTQVVANMTARNLTYETAYQATENGISTTKIVTNPTAMLYNTTNGGYANSITVDINGDTKTTLNVSIPASGQPSCFKAQQVSHNNIHLPAEQVCANDEANNSHCYDVSFQFTAVASDTVTNATSSVTAGAATRARQADARNTCQGPGGQQYF